MKEQYEREVWVTAWHGTKFEAPFFAVVYFGRLCAIRHEDSGARLCFQEPQVCIYTRMGHST